jgi:GTP-binding protein
MIDTVDLDVLGGRGGDGAVSFRREKFVPRGGPDGGDGGRGGNVIIVATRSLSTLRDFHDGRVRRAEDGKAGGPQRKRGASGKSLTLRVPIGCVVRVASVGGDDALDEPEYLAYLALDGMSVIVARGGRGGLGNTRFATSTRQAPKFAQRGQPGASVQLRLELKLLADVGLVGLPNAGKSTLLRAWSAAQPKVGAYPFTTLEPELGVVSVGYDTFVAADMPGLIEGASQGAGLGHEFLRHIERTQVLVHLLDMSREDPVADRALIDAELAAFGHGLADKPQLLALNKVDQPDARARAELLIESGAIREPYLLLSGLTGEGARELAAQAWRLVQGVREAERATVAEELPVLEPPARRERFRVERPDEGPPVVRGSTPEWLAATFNLDDQDARFEFFDRLKKLGVGRALHRVGVEEGDPVRVGDVEVAWDV